MAQLCTNSILLPPSALSLSLSLSLFHTLSLFIFSPPPLAFFLSPEKGIQDTPQSLAKTLKIQLLPICTPRAWSRNILWKHAAQWCKTMTQHNVRNTMTQHNICNTITILADLANQPSVIMHLLESWSGCRNVSRVARMQLCAHLHFLALDRAQPSICQHVKHKISCVCVCACVCVCVCVCARARACVCRVFLHLILLNFRNANTSPTPSRRCKRGKPW